MNILITGGLGYIGSSLTDFLCYLGHNITVVDNLYTQRYCSLFNRKWNFKFIEDDFYNLSADFINTFDYIIHLAAIVDATNSEKQKDLVNSININKTLEFLFRCNTKIIFPSSTSVYGTSISIVHEDDESVLQPQSEYAKAKLYVEQALNNIVSPYRTNFAILRLGTVCGVSRGIRFQTCINKFCYQAVFEQPLTVWKQNLDLVRPYLSLSDINYVIGKILYNWDKFQYQTFNVVTENWSLRQIIQKIKKYIPYITTEYADCPLLNQFSYQVSTQKIEKLELENKEHIGFIGNIDEDIYKTINLLRIKND